MVDFIDSDDYLTPFDWYSGPDGPQFVVGTELPRLVVNEVYAEAVDDPRDRGPAARARHPYQVHFWVELHNPLFADPDLSDGGAARLEVPASAAGPGYPAYRLVLARSPAPTSPPGLRPRRPRPAQVLGVVSDFTPAPPPGRGRSPASIPASSCRRAAPTPAPTAGTRAFTSWGRTRTSRARAPAGRGRRCESAARGRG